MRITYPTLFRIILGTVLLSSMLLIGVTAQTAPYDPWCDLDDDGRISIFDAVNLADRYGTTGTPVRNVSVTNWPDPWVLGTINVTNWPDSWPCQPYPSSGVKGVKISALEWSLGFEVSDRGVLGERVGDENVTLPFAFNPEGTQFNITDAWVSCEVYLTSGASANFGYWMIFNQVESIHSGNYQNEATGGYMLEVTAHPGILTSIHRGINTLTLDPTGLSTGKLYFYRVEIFLEYEYSS